MKNSPFQKTFYLGLISFITPVIVIGIILSLIAINSSHEPKKNQVVNEVVFPPENVIEHDTVYVEKPKPKIVPKVTPTVVIEEPKKMNI